MRSRGRAYDVGIIGGGIAGLYCALELSRYKSVVLFDERAYPGGRIYTHERGYEVGAARFNTTHKTMTGLIDRFKLTPLPLPTRIDHLRTSGDYAASVEKLFGVMLDAVLAQPLKESMRDVTFFELIKRELGELTSEILVDMFGYYSEIMEMNAYDAYKTFKTDFGDVQYYALKEGLSELCRRMVKEIRSKGGVCEFNTEAASVQGSTIACRSKATGETFACEVRSIIFAVKPHQLKRFSVLKPIHRYIRAVYPAPLIRIYAKYPTPAWFENVHRTTTDGILRQIIPIRKDAGLIMVSYTDGADTRPFLRNGKLKPSAEIKRMVSKELSALFSKKIPEPEYMEAHLWSVGCHHWRPGYNSDAIRRRIFSPRPGMYVCGEGFSSKQAWMEGALETAGMVVRVITREATN